MWAVLLPLVAALSVPPIEAASRAPRSLRHRCVSGPLHRGIHEMKDPSGWPAEPPAPAGALDPTRFDAAVAALCRPVAGPTDVAEVARLVREVAGERGADPFLVAALVYRQSRCRPQDRS